MNEELGKDIMAKIKEFDRKLPHFSDGRIDYTNSKEAAIVTIFVEYQGKILLLKRSNKTGNYKERWSVVTGYLDEVSPVEEQIERELAEEVNIERVQIDSVKIAKMIKVDDKIISKIFYGVPALVRLKSNLEMKLNWEHSEFRWIWPEKIREYETVPDLEISLKSVGLLT